METQTNESTEATITHKLRVGFLPMIPWASIASETEKGEIYAGGILGHVFDVLSKDLRFEYHAVIPADNEWGRELSNGTWTGLVGMIRREEIQIIMGPFVPDDVRMVGLEISPVYHSSAFVLLASSGRAEPGSILRFLMTLKSEIWLALFLSMFVMISFSSLVDYLATEKYPRETFNPFKGQYIWTYIAALFYEGTARSPTRSINQFIFALWLLLIMILMNAFTGQLKAVLMVQVDDSVIHSVKDLADHREIIPLIPDEKIFTLCFEDCAFGDYYGVWKNALWWMEKGKQSVINPFTFARPDLYQMIKDGQAVAVIDPSVVKMALSYFCTQLPGNRNFYFVEQVCSGYHLSFAASPNLDKIFLRRLFRKVRYMLEGNLFNRWLSQSSRNYWKCELQDYSQEDQPMAMEHLRSIFYILFVFHGISSTVFVAELILNSKIKTILRKILGTMTAPARNYNFR